MTTKSKSTSIRIDTDLEEKARVKGLDLRALLEAAILKSLAKCPTCGRRNK